jgi:RNA-directed DNA polymerase
LPLVPEAGARCGNSARRDLCGGPSARAVPTATRHGASSKTFSYLSAFTWRRVWIWLRHKHPNATVKELRRRYLPGWWPTQDEARLFKPDAVAIRRYRYRGAAIASPWATTQGVV